MRIAVLGEDDALFGAVERELRARGYDARCLRELTDARAQLAQTEILYAPGSMTIDASTMDAAPRLQALVSPFTGIEGFDREAATTRGILIASGQSDENVDSMAEATVLLLLASALDLPRSIRAMQGDWAERDRDIRARMVKFMTVGLIGYGRIGQAVAARLIGFRCRLLIHAPRLHAPLPEGTERVELAELVAASDAIVLLSALTAQTRHLVDASLFSRTKHGVLLINVARGALIDESALIDAATREQLGGVALDVYEHEPLPGDSPLRSLPHAILTPHCVGHTREALASFVPLALQNILSLLQGRRPPSLVNPEALPAWQASRQLHARAPAP